MIGILPTLADGPHDRGQPQRQPALQAAQRADPQRARRGHHDPDRRIGNVERLETTADSIVPEAACTSTQFHVQTSPDSFAEYWNASQAIAAIQLALVRELAVPARQGAVARDPDPAVRAGHRHPQRGAEGAGRAAPGVVRGALDHLGLRPVRGERPLLPGAAPGHRRRGPARGARGRRRARALRAAAAQRHDLPLEPAGLRHRRRRAAPARREPRARRRARPSSTRWPTPPSTSGWCARSPRASGRCGRRCRSAPPRRTSTWPPGTASTRRSTGPASGQVRRHRAGAAPAAAAGPRGPRRLGRRERDQRPTARDHRAALPDSGRTAPSGSSTGCASAPTWTGRTRSGRRCWTTASGCTPTSPSTPGTGRRGLGPEPHPGPAQPAARVAPAAAVDDHERQWRPASAYAARAAASHRSVDVLQLEPAAAGQPRPAGRARAPARTRSAARRRRAARGRSARRCRRTAKHRAAGDADMQHRWVDAAPCGCVLEDRPPQQHVRVRRHWFAEPSTPLTCPQRRGSTQALHRSSRSTER